MEAFALKARKEVDSTKKKEASREKGPIDGSRASQEASHLI